MNEQFLYKIVYQTYNLGANISLQLINMTNKNKISKFEKILFHGITKEDFDKNQWAKIDSLCKKKVFFPKDNPKGENSMKDIDCLLINQGMIADKNTIESSPHLKYIGILATGYNRIDIKSAASKHVVVCNVPGYATEAVAEFVIGLMLEHIRELERAKKQAREGDYSEATFNGVQIKGKTIGVIGLGRIGQRVAEIASYGFGAKVLYWSRKRKKSLEKNGVVYKSVSRILKEADIVTTHLSYAKETLRFFNKKRIALIKPGTIFINTAPMELIDLKALEKRLRKGDITFILDHSDEMTSKDIERLKKYKNCIVYPPIGFRTYEGSALKKEIFINNLQNFLKAIPNNKVN